MSRWLWHCFHTCSFTYDANYSVIAIREGSIMGNIISLSDMHRIYHLCHLPVYLSVAPNDRMIVWKSRLL